MLPFNGLDFFCNVLDLGQGDDHALHHIGRDVLVFYPERLLIVLDTDWDFGAIQHSIKLLPVNDQ